MGLTNLWGREPVMVLALIQASLVMAVGFGLNLTANQMTLVLTFASVLIAVLTRTQVTSMATLPDHIAAKISIAANADVPKIPVVASVAEMVATNPKEKP